jgi:hypothetical protein
MCPCPGLMIGSGLTAITATLWSEDVTSRRRDDRCLSAEDSCFGYDVRQN